MSTFSTDEPMSDKLDTLLSTLTGALRTLSFLQ